MFHRTLLMLVGMAACSCSKDASEVGLTPSTNAVGLRTSATSRESHPGDHSLRAVPVLIGLPSNEMWQQLREGKVLLGGCVGTPGGSPDTWVCDRCRMWKSDGMKYWQPLPREFGDLAVRDGG